jgi:hypothetical protein
VDLSSNINYVAIDPLQALTDEDGSSSLDVSSIYVDERSGVAASIPLMTSIYPDQPSRRSVQNVNVTQLAIAAVQQWLMQNQNALSISASELFAEGTVRTAVHDDGNLIQLHLGRTHNTLTFVDSRAFATIKRGYLVNIGFERWETLDPDFDTVPKLTVDEAKERLAEWAGEELSYGNDRRRDLCVPELVILTLTKDNVRKRTRQHRNMNFTATTNITSSYVSRTKGYTHALAWRLCPMFENQQHEIMEGIVDATTGQIYSFVDKIDYFTGVGSVYPVSNDGKGEDGTLQLGWPMPYLQVKDVNGENVVMSDMGGNFFSPDESIVSFRGQYALMSDDCGEVKLRINGDFDLGSSDGTDCK